MSRRVSYDDIENVYIVLLHLMDEKSYVKLIVQHLMIEVRDATQATYETILPPGKIRRCLEVLRRMKCVELQYSFENEALKTSPRLVGLFITGVEPDNNSFLRATLNPHSAKALRLEVEILREELEAARMS